MSEYICITETSEVPYGKEFSAIPKYPYEPGDLVLFLIRERYLIIGYWFPSDAGFNWIIQPRRHRRIRLTGKVKCELQGVITSIVGLVVPLMV
jgi:hypothetical protein